MVVSDTIYECGCIIDGYSDIVVILYLCYRLISGLVERCDNLYIIQVLI